MSHYIVEKHNEHSFAVRWHGADTAFCVTPGQDEANKICDALNVQILVKEPLTLPAIHGEFMRIEVAADAQPANNPALNPFAMYHAAMVAELCRVVVPKIGINPLPEEFEDVADYIIRTARMVDRWLKAVGEEVDRNATCKVDMSVFSDTFLAGCEGQSTFECDRAARVLREEIGEVEGAARRGNADANLADDIFKMVRSYGDTLGASEAA